MPQMTLAAWIAWAAVLIAQPAVAAIMLHTGTWRRCPSIFTFVAFKSVVSFTLLAIFLGMRDTDLRAALYFYTYWAAAAVVQLIEIWIIIQICHETAGVSERVRLRITQALLSLAATAMGISLWLVHCAPMAHYGRVTIYVMDMNRALSLAWLMAFLCMASGIELLGIRWDSQTLWLAIGLGLEISGQLAVSWIYSAFPHRTLSDARSAIYTVALAAWAFAMFQTPDALRIAISPDALKQHIDRYRTILQKIRQR